MGEWKKNKKNREGVWQPGVCGRSARSRVWEVFVKYLWVGEAGQIRSEQKVVEIAAVSWINSENLHPVCLPPPPRIIWIKPSSWSHKTPCPTTCWAAGATLYVILPTHCATHISLHLSSHRQTVNLWRLTCLRGLLLLTHPRFPLIHSHCLGFCDVCFPLCDIHRKRYMRLTPAIVCF